MTPKDEREDQLDDEGLDNFHRFKGPQLQPDFEKELIDPEDDEPEEEIPHGYHIEHIPVDPTEKPKKISRSKTTADFLKKRIK